MSSSSPSAATSTASSSSASFTPAIPSIDGNPFISITKMPEGTLFIIFGAILGGIAVLVIGWRAFVVWQARVAAKNSETKFRALEPSYGGPFVDPVLEAPQSEAVGPFGAKRQLSKRTKQRIKSNDKEMRRKEAAKFFSPTVEVMTHGNPTNAPMVTSSTYLPSGYYTPSVRGPATLASRPMSMAMGTQAGYNSTVSVQSATSRPQSVAMTMSGPSDAQTDPTASRENLRYSQAPRARKLRPPSQYLDDLIGSR